MTPYELRYKIYEDARTMLEDEYQYLLEKFEKGELKGIQPVFPTHSRILSVAKEINEFISHKDKE